MVGDDNGILLTKGDLKLHFNHKVNTSQGCLFVIKLSRLEDTEVGMGSIDSKPITIIKAHKILTHCGEADTRKTCKHLGIELTRGCLPSCLDCGLAKARQKNLPKSKETVLKITIPDDTPKEKGQIRLDLSKLA